MNGQPPAQRDLRVRIEAGAVLGVWVSKPTDSILELMDGSDADYLGIDCQHGYASEADLPRLLVRAFTTPRLVRVADSRHSSIGRALDAGADGIIVPMVDTVRQAEAIVRAVRYPPRGIRSYGPIAPYLSRDHTVLEIAPLVLAMIETAEGLHNLEEILAVDGIDGVYVGPADLGITLGDGPAQFPPTSIVREHMKRVAASAAEAGKFAGVHAGLGSFAQDYLSMGYRMITLGNEQSVVVQGMSAELRAAGREAAVTSAKAGY
ncbi:HpcH/HpaI aldolase/citrate lyase family protein [Rhodococcus sp. NCIMB 12038]|uniref:HpcH/HpaI aldolase family protein n=1 Tax=Rhodococcus sp. NCIMB 12038 TaxID=933800 RepID=UPI000B3CCF5D|nr:aldolase/citrate lyase family protein [Rhodococcus sp. NCIMB 12038]OUS83977.1 2-dehydro-3-deoxyglucarate aldolase [Rhodococcus sp. NCIMB 12038]